MKTIVLLFVKLLRALTGLGLFLIVMFFFNHIIGFVFDIHFKSVGKPTLEILGLEILGGALMGGVYWLLDKLHTNLSSSQFTSYLQKAMKNIENGSDIGKQLLLNNTQGDTGLQNSIQDKKSWVTSVNVTKNSISGADAKIIDYGQKVILKTVHNDTIEISVDDLQLAQIIVHLLLYHDENIFNNLNSL